MDERPRLVNLPSDLQAVQRRWLELKREEQDALYATEFAPGFASLFASLPLHGAPIDLERPLALVSVLGLSWQPVALMAAWARPEKILVLGTRESLGIQVGDEGVLSLIARIAGVSRDAIERVEVGDPGETDIYRAVRDFLHRSALPPRRVFVDPTGGKKSMSASAALAGFLSGTPLVYVDYGEYHGPRRIPIAGTEYPRLLTNPLSEFGDLEMRDVFAAFNRGDFHEAEMLAARLAGRLYEPREAECLTLLARAYGAWDRFDFKEAGIQLGAAIQAIDNHSRRGGWRWVAEIRGLLGENLRGLATLEEVSTSKPQTLGEGLPLVAWYLAVAERHLGVGRNSLAMLVTYAAMERYVDLCLWVRFGLDDEQPDYARIEGRLDNGRYHDAGRRFFGKDYRKRDMEGPLMFGNGAQLLAALDPDLMPMENLGPMRGLSTGRNKCEFEHGLNPCPVGRSDVERHLERARAITMGAIGRDVLEKWLDTLRFPPLSNSH